MPSKTMNGAHTASIAVPRTWTGAVAGNSATIPGAVARKISISRPSAPIASPTAISVRGMAAAGCPSPTALPARTPAADPSPIAMAKPRGDRRDEAEGGERHDAARHAGPGGTVCAPHLTLLGARQGERARHHAGGTQQRGDAGRERRPHRPQCRQAEMPRGQRPGEHRVDRQHRQIDRGDAPGAADAFEEEGGGDVH
ncbi:hypothetical protein WR25_19352 [Diploscapter pachys]|uniref:Uncharacterized protein n=1 Tax=Diploscapter pachys TaxID=2018661 RepID=A0A2A2JXK0_9BILA|nr:hypothetical protein WR25_19352 [Diploscapter pachys]